MMTYPNILAAKFIARPNRFIAEVEIGGTLAIAHVKNTGRCRELLVPGITVYLSKSDNLLRKTQYDLVAVQKGARLINMDSQAPNKVFYEHLQAGLYIENIMQIKPEAKYINSRFDFYVKAGSRKIFIEVKGVTLEEDSVVLFPDAPTERGVKHLRELAALTHDIGIKNAEAKFGSAAGHYQQTEGPPEAEKLLCHLGVTPQIIDRVCWLIARHHTYKDITGTDYQIMKQGWSVQEIQDALRAAVEDMVPQTLAPDDVSDGENGGETMIPPIEGATYFVPLEESVVAAFSAGELDGNALMAQICAEKGLAVLDDLTGLDLVLTDFGKSPAFEDATDGGEIVAGPDGEAFMPEYLTVSEPDGSGYHICEPMVFKTAEEVRAAAAMLMGIDEKAFRNKADIKKLIKSGWLSGYDKRSVKKEADYIKTTLLAQFAMLRTPYLQAAAQGKGVVIFVGYTDAKDRE
jgi:sugar fermentation stimulation protein